MQEHKKEYFRQWFYWVLLVTCYTTNVYLFGFHTHLFSKRPMFIMYTVVVCVLWLILGVPIVAKIIHIYQKEFPKTHSELMRTDFVSLVKLGWNPFRLPENLHFPVWFPFVYYAGIVLLLIGHGIQPFLEFFN